MLDSKQIQRLDLNLLKVFQTLYQERNMTRTAELLNLTPSAISHAVARLRESLEDPLFHRSNNQMVPTPNCQRIAPLIIDNMARLHQILQQLGEFSPATSQYHFRIGMHDGLERTFLSKLTGYLADRAPGVTVSSVKIDRNDITRELTAGNLDAVIDIALPIRPPVRHAVLMEDELVVLMRKEHPYASNLSSKQYMAAEHILVSNRPSGVTAADVAFQQRGLDRNVKIRCQNYYSATDILKQTDLLLTVPSSLAHQLVDAELISVEVPYNIPSFSVHLYWHGNTDQDAALSWLRSCILNQSGKIDS